MKSTILTLCAALALAASPLTAADELNGKWQIHNSIAGNESDMECTFTQRGEELSGTCETRTGPSKISGKVAEKKVSWTVNTQYEGSPLTLKYAGTLGEDGKMKGMVSVDPFNVDGDFTASPVK